MPSRGSSEDCWGRACFALLEEHGQCCHEVACVRRCQNSSSAGNGLQRRALACCILLCSPEGAYDMLLATGCV